MEIFRWIYKFLFTKDTLKNTYEKYAAMMAVISILIYIVKGVIWLYHN